MVTQSTPVKNSTLLGSGLGPLELRVTNAPLAGQVVQLHGTKCTIGSGRRCTLRLQARRVEPVHCLIMRGKNGTVIRRWSTNTRLNGAAFTDALLQPGDRLTLGPIVLEVVSTGRALEQSSMQAKQILETSVSTPTSVPPTSADNEALQARLAELTEREELLALQEEELLEKQLAWEAEQQEKQEEIDELRHKLGNAQQRELDLPVLAEEHERLESELAERQKQLDDQQTELRRAQEAFETNRLAQENALVQRRRELDEQADSLTLQREKLIAEQEKHHTQQKEAAEAFEQREAELNSRQLELDQALKDSSGQDVAHQADLLLREEDLAAAQAQWASERSMWEITFQQTSDELKEMEQKLEEERRQWEQDKVQTEANLSEQQEALEQLRQALQAKQDRLDAQQNEWNHAYARQSAELEEQKAKLAAESQAWEEQRASLQSKSESEEESQDSFEPAQAPESLFGREDQSDRQREQAFRHTEEEATDEPAFEPLTSISDSLSYLTKEKGQQEQEKIQHASSLEEDVTSQQVGLDNYELSDEPTELENSAAQAEAVSEESSPSAFVTEPESADSEPQQDATERSRSLAEEFIGKVTGATTSPATEEEGSEAEEQASHVEEEEEDTFEPVSSTLLHEAAASAEDSAPQGQEAVQETEHGEDEEPEFSEPQAASPAENSGLMERLRAMTDWDEDEEESDGTGFQNSMPRPAEHAPTHLGYSQPSSQQHQSADEDEEESIEDYMAKMMMRIRGAQGTPSPSAQPKRSQPEKKPEPIAEAKPREERHAAETESATENMGPQKPFEMAPRRAPVELTSNLAAMRELANVSAREAIDLSVRNRWAQAAVGKFSVAGIALLAAVILFYWTTDPMSVTFLGGGVASLIAVFWALQGAVILNGVRKAKERYGMPLSEEEQEAQLKQRIYEDTPSEIVSTPELRQPQPAVPEAAEGNEGEPEDSSSIPEA